MPFLHEMLRSCSADEAARLVPTIQAQLDAVKVDELDGPPLCDVAPLADRLVLFYSDYRVPHEVLPAHHERLAITLWYFDADEHARAHAKGQAADFEVFGLSNAELVKWISENCEFATYQLIFFNKS